MGGAVSSGIDNDSLVDNLIKAEYITSPEVERVFRAVDRGFYYEEDQRRQAYTDRAWKLGNLHLSAPCIYTKVMEALELKPGHSFLNLGSGTGYLNTMAGLMIGPFGVNHGIEIHPDVVAYAEQKLEEFRTTPAVDEFDFSEPLFTVGNCLSIPAGCRRYDRVYCGAGCSVDWKLHIESLLEVGGILIAPVEDQLLKITRRSEKRWESTELLSVSFAPLVSPSDDETEAPLPPSDVPYLQSIVRSSLRREFRKQINMENPELWRCMRRTPRRKESPSADRYSQFSIVPIPLLTDSDGDSDMDVEHLPRLEAGSDLWRIARELVNVRRRGERAAENADENGEHFYAEGGGNDGMSSDEDWVPGQDDGNGETESVSDGSQEDEPEELAEVDKENTPAGNRNGTACQPIEAQSSSSNDGGARRSKFDSGVADLSGFSSSSESHDQPPVPTEEPSNDPERVTEDETGTPTRSRVRRSIKLPQTDEPLEDPQPTHHCTGMSEGQYVNLMRDKIASLPLPPRLKAYLNFYRPLSVK